MGIEVFPEWAPGGAEQFKEMVKDIFFDRTRIYRVIPGVGCSFGISGNTHTSRRWRDQVIRFEAAQVGNDRGMIGFADTGSVEQRSTQLWVNFRNNPALDAKVAPFGKVIRGLDLLERAYAEYGDGPDFARLPSQKPAEGEPPVLYEGPSMGRLYDEGDSYIDANFPLLSRILAADFIQHKDGNPVTVSIPHIDRDHEHISRFHHDEL